MPELFINTLRIQNFKCFEDESIEFNVPDGTPGSGLNVLIGENGNGKTSVLEALNLLTQSTYSVENSIDITDFRDHAKKIVFTGHTMHFDVKMPDLYRNCSFECNGFELSVESRRRKEAGKLLSSAFNALGRFRSVSGTYKDSTGVDTGKDVRTDALIFRNAAIIDGEINVFMFDKNRNRQISTGTYKTTFERICEDFNWRFLKNLDDATKNEIVEKISNDVFRLVINQSAKGAGSKLATELGEFLDSDYLKNLKIDLLNLLHPFSTAFFSVREDNEIRQIRSNNLGSGIEMVLTILLLRSISGEAAGSLSYLIDEPELHLHPKAQFELVKLLIEEAKEKQIILSTHSPYIFKDLLVGNSRMIIFRRDSTTERVIIDYPATAGWGKFPWSPSWGEINFHAFGLSTVELHNELFGYIQERNSITNIAGLDAHLAGNGFPQNKVWVKTMGAVSRSPQNVTLPVYVRNSIHHPENLSNPRYTPDELKDSIEMMLGLV